MIDQTFVQSFLVPGVEFLTAFGGVPAIVAFFKSWADRRKIIDGVPKHVVETVPLLPPSASEGFESMRAQITDLKARLREAEARAEEYETRLRQLGGGS